MLRYLRVGYTSWKYLELLHKRKMIKGGIFNKLEFCQECALTKQIRVLFGDGKQSFGRVIDYIHSNV